MEGIKPQVEDGQVGYSVKDGTFKNVCSSVSNYNISSSSLDGRIAYFADTPSFR